MPFINVSDDVYQRIEAFVPIARAVLNEDVDIAASLDIVTRIGFRAGLNTIIQPQEESVLVQALHQMAELSPHLVCGHTAAVIALGADIYAQQRAERQVGFVRTTRGE
jgi:1,6-anhydro-N-acetylmuramate kinase